MDASNQFAQIIAFAPMVLPILGLPKEKINMIVTALSAPDAMINNQPNVALLMKLKSELEAYDAAQAEQSVTARLICVNCKHCNTFELRG